MAKPCSGKEIADNSSSSVIDKQWKCAKASQCSHGRDDTRQTQKDDSWLLAKLDDDQQSDDSDVSDAQQKEDEEEEEDALDMISIRSKWLQ